MGKTFSKEDPNARYPITPREHYTRLGLVSPPENGYDDFLKLVWCRDLKEEGRQAKKAEKEGKKDFKAEEKHYLCIVGIYEPYRKNEPPINLNKRGYKPLPKWSDNDFREEILRNGYFFQNDAFILEHYKQAIKPAEDYPYVEQFIPAYKHWNNGQEPSKEQIREHKISVAVIVMEDIDRLENAEEGDKDDDMLQKMKDILISMDIEEEEDLEECKKRLEQKKAAGAQKK